MKFLRAFAVALLIPAAALAFGQTASWKKYFTVFNQPQGSAYIRGSSVVAAKDGGGYAVSDTAIAKFDQTGAIEWTASYFARASAPKLVEGSTGFYVASYALRGFEANTKNLTKPDYEVQLVKYDNAGHFQFSRLLGFKPSGNFVAPLCVVRF